MPRLPMCPLCMPTQLHPWVLFNPQNQANEGVISGRARLSKLPQYYGWCDYWSIGTCAKAVFKYFGYYPWGNILVLDFGKKVGKGGALTLIKYECSEIWEWGHKGPKQNLIFFRVHLRSNNMGVAISLE